MEVLLLLVESAASWDALTETDEAYCYYNNLSTNGEIYGALYTWAAMNGSASSTSNPSGVQGTCPDGWHIPSDTEWTDLTNYLGGEGIAGGKMKEIGLIHWDSPNTGATNESGFTGLPNGRRYKGGTFGGLGNFESLWSTSNGYISTDAWYRYLNYDDTEVRRVEYDKASGHSIRCIRD